MLGRDREQSPWRRRLAIGAAVVGGLALTAGAIELGRRVFNRERVERALGVMGIGEPAPTVEKVAEVGTGTAAETVSAEAMPGEPTGAGYSLAEQEPTVPPVEHREP